jgi:TonB family protein
MSIGTLLGAVLGLVAINYSSLWSHTATRSTDATTKVANLERDKPIVGGALNGKEALLPNPEYPPSAKREGASGQVTVAVVVGKDGTVTSARALNGDPLLRTLSVAAARKRGFPADIDQLNVGSWNDLYNFSHDSRRV